MPNIWPTIELTAQDLVYNVLAVCHASIDDLKYSRKKNRKALRKLERTMNKEKVSDRRVCKPSDQ